MVKVYKHNTVCKTFDSLRASLFKANDSIFDLPPTSHSIIQGHIPRWFFLVREQSNLLNPSYDPLDPCDYQWSVIDEELWPIKNLLLLPKNLTVTCLCKNKDTAKRCDGRCSCLKEGSYCIDYCGCAKCCCNSPITSHQPKRKKSLKGSHRTRQRAH